MHKQLEDYLQRLEAALAPLPSQARAEEVREIEAHLRILIEGNRERGVGEDEAVALSLRQFGDAETVGRDLRRQWNKKSEHPARMVLAMGGAFVCYRVCGTLSRMAVWAIDNHLSQWPNQPVSPHQPFWWLSMKEMPVIVIAVSLWFMLALPLLSGWVAGVLAPKRALSAVGTLYLSLILCYWFEPFWFNAPLGLAAVSLHTWPMASAGASLQARWARREMLKRAVR